MEKEVYWSRFALDFEKRNTYVVGKTDFDMMKQKIAGIENPGRVLELGCGNGTYSQILAGNAEHVWATDFSDEMIDAAGKRLKRYANVTVEKQNCFDLTYDTGGFDTVAMVNLLHIIPTPRKALEEAIRVIRPGGRIYILSLTIAGMKPLDKLRMIWRYLKTYGRPPENREILDHKTVRDLLLRAGFMVHENRLIGDRSKAVWAWGSA